MRGLEHFFASNMYVNRKLSQHGAAATIGIMITTSLEQVILLMNIFEVFTTRYL